MATTPAKVARTEEDWRKRLTPELYAVARQKATEPAFSGKYTHGTEVGTYRCSACGLAVFSSGDKFDSGSGWPSFTRPAHEEHVREETDHGHAMTRTEVLCQACDAHLGHVFDDGPDATGRRYCINSISLDLDTE